MKESGPKSYGAGMICPKHKTYKGRRKKKTRCETCDSIYKELQKKTNSFKPYKSFSTPGMSCSLYQLIAEISCVQLFGPQPPHFWYKDSPARPRVKKHYQKIFKGVMMWDKKHLPSKLKKQNPIREFDKVMWFVSTQYKKQEEAEKMRSMISIPVEEIVKNVDSSPKEAVDFDLGTTKKTKFEALNEVRNASGKEDEKEDN